MADEELPPEKKEEGKVEIDPAAQPPEQLSESVQPPPKTPEQPEQPESIIAETPPIAPEEFKKEEPFVASDIQPEQPCDPATMTCDELRDKLTEELLPEVYKHKSAVEKIEEIKKTYPSPEIDKALSAATEKMDKTNKEIADVFEKYKYAICEKPTEKKEQENPQQ